MKTIYPLPAAVLLGLGALFAAQAQVKPATINVQNAILSTKDGQKAQSGLETKFTPRKSALDKKQSEIAGMQDQLKKGSATLSQAARDKLMRDIDAGQTALKRDQEDFQTEVQQEEAKVMGELGQKMMDVIGKYATAHGITMVVDVSNPQAPVLWADASIDITNDIVKQYDQAAGSAAAPPPAATPSTPAAPPVKKQ